MSSTTAAETLEFVDTNVLVYAHDTSAQEKRVRAAALIEGFWTSRCGALSTQVLQEFYVVATRKIASPLRPGPAKDVVERFAAWKTFEPRTEDVVAAIDISVRHRISYWDALIARSASRLGCTVLWSEDLADRQVIAGVRIRNPFA